MTLEIFQQEGIGLFTIGEAGDSLEVGEAPEDTIENVTNTNALKYNKSY